MKKYLLLALIAVCIGLIIPCKVYATDITLGATTWYVERDAPGDLTYDSTFMFGPVLSVKFNDDFNLTFVYLYGQFKDSYGIGIKIKRQDSDLALNYRLNDYFKLFGGIKYMNYTFSGQGLSEDVYSYGPALGLSFTYPIVDNLFFLATLSGSYIWYKGDDFDGNEYGYNGNISLAYYISSASTVISLGYRYQRFIDTEYSEEKTTISGFTLTATYSFNI